MSKSKLWGPPLLFCMKIQAIWQKKLASLLEKKTLEPFCARFENTMGNPFYDFVKYRSKCSKKNINYIVLYEKNAFRINFGPWEVPQSENT